MDPLNIPGSQYNMLRLAVDSHLETVVSGLSPGSLRDAVGHAVEDGKRVRPMITLLSCAATGGRELDALNPAVAVELLHSASLVHDDIMDDAPLRRGRPTLHAAFGLSSAILAGDTMIALAFRTLQGHRTPRRAEVMELFTEGFVDLCEGQGGDLTGPGWGPGGTHRNTVEKKTARLIEVAAGAGAMTATGDADVVRVFRSYGRSLGMAFQARDDLLDVVGDERATGKPVGADRRNGRTTYLTLAHPEADTVSIVTGIVDARTEEAVKALRTVAPSPARHLLQSLALSLRHRPC